MNLKSVYLSIIGRTWAPSNLMIGSNFLQNLIQKLHNLPEFKPKSDGFGFAMFIFQDSAAFSVFCFHKTILGNKT